MIQIIKGTRLGLQCQTPALSKVYFTWVGTIILGLKKIGSKKNLKLKKFLVPKNFNLLKCLVPKNYFGPKKIFD